MKKIIKDIIIISIFLIIMGMCFNWYMENQIAEPIKETEVYKKRFSRLKFVFFSRPYVFENRCKLSYKDSILDIPQTGDASLEKICEK